jgi:CubicO group peptidase (beta-lactamase class C family)
MTFEIIGDVDKNRLYCVGSFTKMLTTFVCLSKLAEQYDLTSILDDNDFFDRLCMNSPAKNFLSLFQTIIGSRFSLHDICSFYSGLPYTFDLSEKELTDVEAGKPFKHHSILDENDFLNRCQTLITPVFANHSKFHYSEIAIIFLGYLLEKVYDLKIESLYQQYIITPYQLTKSSFSRTLVPGVYIQDLSDQYDYPAIAVNDHGYFSYSNGFYTTLLDTQKLMNGLIHHPVFQFMTHIKQARAASNRLLNGLTVEIRIQDDDILYGYEGLSFSGCNLWAYSTKHNHGFLTISDSEEDVYPFVYGQWGSDTFDRVPEYTQQIYQNFLKQYAFDYTDQAIPAQFQGQYHRVNINEKTLDLIFTVGEHFIEIRNPDMVRYDVVYLNNTYRIKGKDNIPGSKVGFYRAESGHCYFLFDGNLYRKIMN